jgi:dTDP-4-dehydrorhamnose reductase
MKISITGANGNLGSRLVKMGCDPLLCDIRSREGVEVVLKRSKPDVVLHLAAMTSVDWCEKNELEAVSVNVYGTALLCEVASDLLGEGKVVVLSTDQVFNGLEGNYKEDAQPDPINVYGKSKLAAEEVANLYDNRVIRISRCFDENSKDIQEYIGWLKRGEEVQVPNFMWRSYCHSQIMAEMIWKYAQNFDKMPPVLHLAGANPYSFYSLVLNLSAYYRLNTDLVCTRGDRPGYAPRPFRTGLNIELAKNLGFEPPLLPQSIGRL